MTPSACHFHNTGLSIHAGTTTLGGAGHRTLPGIAEVLAEWPRPFVCEFPRLQDECPDSQHLTQPGRFWEVIRRGKAQHGQLLGPSPLIFRKGN